MPSPIKTNVSRILDSAGVSYKMHTYESHGEALDGQSVAQALGVDPRCLFKTLVTKGHDGEHRVFVVPCTGELDLKAAARAAGCKSVEMIHVKDLQKVTGYIRGGCSPLGMKRPYPVSYTHLDVYKRQGLRAAAKRPGPVGKHRHGLLC